jgi:hypothetical protein
MLWINTRRPYVFRQTFRTHPSTHDHHLEKGPRMQEAKGRKPKIVFYPRHNNRFPIPGSTEDDFAIYASYQINAGGMFVGLLKVVRKTDSRLLFPFEGASTIGPFRNKFEAVSAAEKLGREIVAGDLRSPEL